MRNRIERKSAAHNIGPVVICLALFAAISFAFQTAYCVEPAVSALKTVTHTLEPGWNLISAPVEPELTSALEQLGDDLPMLDVYQLFDGEYYVAENADIQAGLGYWVYVEAGTQIDIVGLPVIGEGGIRTREEPVKPLDA